MVYLIVAIVAALAMAYYVVEFLRDYAKATGTMWEKALTASEESATMLWGKFVAFIGMGGTAAVSLSDYFNDPTLTDAIKAALKPEFVAPFVFLVAVVTIYARRRTLPKA